MWAEIARRPPASDRRIPNTDPRKLIISKIKNPSHMAKDFLGKVIKKF